MTRVGSGLGPLPLSLLEVLTGVVLGVDESLPVPTPDDGDPLKAWEHLFIPLLEASPCFVAFSGGRDSSAILAVATQVARKHGLDEPVPVTLRFAGVEGTEESEYQDALVSSLRLRRWERIDPGDSLDILGEISTDLSRRFGLLYPGNVQFVVPMAQQIRGGTLLIGLGGDEVMSGHPYLPLVALLMGRRRPGRAALRIAAKRVASRFGRGNGPWSEVSSNFPWLTPRVRRVFARALADDARVDPLLADRALLRRTYRQRYLWRTMHDIQLVSDAYGVRTMHPFLDESFLSSFAGKIGASGLATRTDAMRTIFATVLEEAWIKERRKAHFDGAFWTPLAARWAPTLDTSSLEGFVDRKALVTQWASDVPQGNTYILAKYLRMREF